MTDQRTVDSWTSFAEWRGTVKTALDFIKSSLKRLEAEDQEQWETIEQVRGMLEKARDRCDQLSQGRAMKADVDALRCELDKKASVKDFDEFKKVSVKDFDELKTEVNAQGKIQIKQGVTLLFYGTIGGALFTILLNMATHFLKK